MTTRSTWKIFSLLCLFLWQIMGCETDDLSVGITADISGPVEPGTTVTLSWSSVNATTCSIEPDVGVEIGLTGSVSVTPALTTTYTITATNDAGATVQDSLTLTVLSDSDNDGVSDGNDRCPDTPAGETVDANGCSDSQKDTDNDGLSDADEKNTYGTDPNLKDTDGDGVDDFSEVTYGGEPCSLDPLNPDDGSRDCDGDLYSNKLEIKLGSDVADSSSVPAMNTSFDYDAKGRIHYAIHHLQNKE